MESQLVSIDTIRAAAARIASIAFRTPLIRAPFPGISGHGTNKEIYLKAESLQPIGAFKIAAPPTKFCNSPQKKSAVASSPTPAAIMLKA